MKRATKQILSLLLLLTLAFGIFSGCATQPQAPDTTDTKDTADTVPDDTKPDEPQPSDTEEYFLEREPGTNQITFYWYSDGADYAKCDMWIWFPNADGRGYLFHPCEYGAKVVLNVPEDVTEVGFIVRKNCSDPGGTSWGDATKDYSNDRFAAITGPDTKVYLKPGDKAMYLSDDGGKTLYQAKVLTMAGIMTLNQIRYTLSPATRITSLDQIELLEGDRKIEITDLSSLNNEVVSGVIFTAEELDVSKNYVLKIEGFDPVNVVPTFVFDSDSFNETYAYNGDDLGAYIDGEVTRFKLWAPTASSVKINLYENGDGGAPFYSADMTKGDFGVWSAEFDSFPGTSSERPAAVHGTYYTYTVTTSLGENEVVDPYAKAAGVNGNRGMVVDLSKTDPEGFDRDEFYDGITSYNQAVIWEVHVRDFSNRITSSKYPGKYLAFTEKGLVNSSGEPVGLDYLVDLGITHVHLQPVYDYATVDESSDDPQFNWGYDPKNYNIPEGSYSTDPYHGEVRITEFKQMVQALHEAGLGVVMDVVYNHTYDANSNFTKIVPYYYYRYDSSGMLSNGSGCGNETASERAMFRKFMVDSVKYWASEYHIDGFRFDLMALHDTETMQQIEAAVHGINPHAIIYGEGWTGGTTTLTSGKQANQANIKTITPTEPGIGAVAVFNDAIRDGLKGSVFDAKDTGYINGTVNKSNASKVVFGITGGLLTPGVGWNVPDNAVVNYMACHDNNTLWDKLLISNPDNTDAERLQMNRFGTSIIMMSKGIPFFLAGEEILRTKDGDHNSYNSSDEINNIDWDSLKEGSPEMEMRDFYRALISMRKANGFFTEAAVFCEINPDNSITVRWEREGELLAHAFINPTASQIPFTLPETGTWYPLLMDEKAVTEAEPVEGTVNVAPGTVFIAVLVP